MSRYLGLLSSVHDTGLFFFVASQKPLLKLSCVLPYVPAADATLLFGDADDITSDEDEQAAPAAESPASRQGSGDERDRDSDRERSRDLDDEDENKQSLPVIDDVSSCKTALAIEMRLLCGDGSVTKVVGC